MWQLQNMTSVQNEHKLLLRLVHNDFQPLTSSGSSPSSSCTCTDVQHSQELLLCVVAVIIFYSGSGMHNIIHVCIFRVLHYVTGALVG